MKLRIRLPNVWNFAQAAFASSESLDLSKSAQPTLRGETKGVKIWIHLQPNTPNKSTIYKNDENTIEKQKCDRTTINTFFWMNRNHMHGRLRLELSNLPALVSWVISTADILQLSLAASHCHIHWAKVHQGPIILKPRPLSLSFSWLPATDGYSLDQVRSNHLRPRVNAS